MIYELKPPLDDSSGLLVFTHKERPLFTEAPPALVSRLRRLKRRYVLAMQWGRYHEGVGETPFVDVHMACPGTVEFREDADVRRIPMCSRNFVPSYFRPMDVPVRWDVLSVGHPIRDKRYAEMLDAVRMAFDAGVDIRVLLICAVPDDPSRLGSKWDHAFFEKYDSLLSDAERARIDLGVPGEIEFGNRPIHPILNEVFPYLYNAAAGFALFSAEKGHSKVIHEALLCGTPVVVRENLKGGGRDYLDDRNSMQFGTTREARDAFDPTYLRPELSEAGTADRLESEIAAVFDDIGRPYHGEIEKTDIAFKFGSHTITLPLGLRRGDTNDLRSPGAAIRHAESLLGEGPDTRDRIGGLAAAVQVVASTRRRDSVDHAKLTSVFDSQENAEEIPTLSAGVKPKIGRPRRDLNPRHDRDRVI